MYEFGITKQDGPCDSLILQREMGMIVHRVASAGQGCEASACHPLLGESGKHGRDRVAHRDALDKGGRGPEYRCGRTQVFFGGYRRSFVRRRGLSC